MIILSPHLTEAEFLGTSQRDLLDEQDRIWHGTPALQEAGQRFAATVFEQVRKITGPLHVNSGYRCPALNLRVGGRSNSRHMLALAADVVPIEMDIREAMHRITLAAQAGVVPDLDEAIFEFGRWIHIQAATTGSPARRLALQTADGKSFAAFA